MPACRYCPAWALTFWWLDGWDLERYLCGHHSNEHAEELVTAGWVLIEDERVESLPRLAALTGDPATH